MRRRAGLFPARPRRRLRQVRPSDLFSLLLLRAHELLVVLPARSNQLYPRPTRNSTNQATQVMQMATIGLRVSTPTRVETE